MRLGWLDWRFEAISGFRNTKRTMSRLPSYGPKGLFSIPHWKTQWTKNCFSMRPIDGYITGRNLFLRTLKITYVFGDVSRCLDRGSLTSNVFSEKRSSRKIPDVSSCKTHCLSHYELIKNRVFKSQGRFSMFGSGFFLFKRRFRRTVWINISRKNFRSFSP